MCINNTFYSRWHNYEETILAVIHILYDMGVLRISNEKGLYKHIFKEDIIKCSLELITKASLVLLTLHTTERLGSGLERV